MSILRALTQRFNSISHLNLSFRRVRVGKCIFMSVNQFNEMIQIEILIQINKHLHVNTGA